MTYRGPLKPISNRATWTDSVQCFDDETNEPIDISDATEIVFEVSECEGYRAVLSASLTGGDITLEDTTGVFSFSFTPDQVKTLCARTYFVGCTITVSGETIQVISGTLPIINGYVQ